LIRLGPADADVLGGWARTRADEHEVISHIIDRVFAAAGLDAAVLRQLVREQLALYYPGP
jgi:hypothetical protein